jgi:hypothetical protein
MYILIVQTWKKEIWEYFKGKLLTKLICNFQMNLAASLTQIYLILNHKDGV